MSRLRSAVPPLSLAALISVLLVACGGGGESDAEPREVLASATVQGVESGKFDITMEIRSKGDTAGESTVQIAGAFQEKAGSQLPLLDLTMSVQGEAEGEELDFEGGLTLLADRAFVGLNGTEYEVDAATFGYVKSSIEQGFDLPRAGGGEGACADALSEADLEALLGSATNAGGAEVDGQETTKISGDLDLEGLIGVLDQLKEDPACAKELESAGGMPLGEIEKQFEELTGFAETVDVDVYVGENGIVRRLTAAIVAKEKSGGTIEIDVDATLTDVNETQEISAPSSSRPLEELLQTLDVNPLELLEGSEEGFESLFDALLDGAIQQGGSGGGDSGGGSGGDGSEGGGSGGGGSGGGGSEGGGSGGGGSEGGFDLSEQREYLECLGEAESAADLQDCADFAP